MNKQAMRANIGMGQASPLLLAALSVAVAGCSGNNNGSASGALGASTFSPASVIQSSQTIIALDPVNQAIWVPSYTLDANGNLQYELISTAAAVAGGTATGSKSVSLAGCDTPIGITYASGIGAFLVECGNSTKRDLYLSAVDAKSQTVTPIATPGLSWTGSYGGIIYDPQHNQAIVADSQSAALLQVPAGGAPSFEANSVTALPSYSFAGSMAMNFTTQQVVLVDPNGLPCLVDTSTLNTAAPALNIPQLQGFDGPNSGLPIQGVAFDSATDVIALASDLGVFGYNDVFGTDGVEVLNMPAYYVAPQYQAYRTGTEVFGFEEYYVGHFLNSNTILNSIGGLAALNATTHQALVADAWGPNLLLIQLPTAAPGPSGIVDSKGQPTPTGVPSSTPPDALSAYPISQTLVWPQTIGTPAQLNAIGTPPALAIDQTNNIAYVLADDSLAPHAWTANTGVTLALVSVDLSAPVPGACPSPNNLCVATWNPRIAQAVVP